MRSSIRYIFFPGIVALVIFYVTCIINVDSIPVSEKVFQYDKVVHFGMFFTLSAAIYFDYYRFHNGAPKKTKWILFGLIFPVIYGGAIEIVQEHYFSRSGDWLDFAADALGSLSATFLALMYLSYIRKR